MYFKWRNKGGYYFTDMIADGISERGKKLCDGFGMERIGDSKHNSAVYYKKLTPLTFVDYSAKYKDRLNQKNINELQELYKILNK